MRRAGFTLIELMVVIGLMALLGTISVTSYFAAVRGMSDRAAVQDTIALMQGGIISQAERDLAAPLPLCMNITHDIGGGGYVRMKGE